MVNVLALNVVDSGEGSRPEDFIGIFVISVQTSHQLSLIVNDIAEKLLIKPIMICHYMKVAMASHVINV
jgi:hypothetical protein